MKIEHKLSAAYAAYVERTLAQLNELREQYLAALGRAKETELQAEICRQSLQQQLKLVEEAENLPRTVAPYRLNAEGTALVGEVPDQPAPAAVPHFDHAPLVNGAAAEAGV